MWESRRGNAALWLALAVGVSACAGGPEPADPAPAVPADTVALGEPVEEADTAAAVDTVAVEEPAEVEAVPEPAEEPADTAAVVEEPVEEAVEEAVEEEAERVVEEGWPRGPYAVPVLPGAVMPQERIIAFYGNPASRRMGILGELSPDAMLAQLEREVKAWNAADPDTPARPALHMIAVMATGDPGADSLYRLRLPDWRIEQVAEWADQSDALLFLDIQPGMADVREEIDRLEPWLTRPDVHLALDPEWAMEEGQKPGTRIGSMTAAEINYAIDLLARLVEEHDLPPKVLVVHRFTENMIRNAEDIRLDPRVQVVINMDGWGPPSQKRYAYREIVAPEADQFTGFKLFYKNDLRNDSRLMTPSEILGLTPNPYYIQYQ